MGLNEQLAEIGRLIAVRLREQHLADVTRRRHDSYGRGATCAPETLRYQSGRILRSPPTSTSLRASAALPVSSSLRGSRTARTRVPTRRWTRRACGRLCPVVQRGAGLMRVLGEGRTEVPCGGCSWAGDPATISTSFGDSGWRLPPAEGRPTAKAQVLCLTAAAASGSWAPPPTRPVRG